MELRNLIAKEGMRFTNGTTFGKVITLGINDSPLNWYEITEEEYLELTKSEEESVNV